jgi:serine/threonine-protein kinase RsbW
MNELNLEIPSLSENIRIVESFIDNAKDKYNISDDMYGNIMVAVTESVNNAITHGNGGDSKKNVKLKLLLGENEIRFTIKDEGPGFDYENLPDPTAPENLEKVGGRGIFLMNHLCETVNFEDNGATIELVFSIE